eukprot:11347816-Heterocapsa_arctica.AAC.1
MMLASESEIGLNEWFRVAVETRRFYKGGAGDTLTVRTKKTVARITEFIDPVVQTAGQRWMAEGLVGLFRRAIEAYNTFLITHHHDQAVIDLGVSGTSDSTAVAAIVAYPQLTPEAIELRKLLLRPPA